MPSEEHVMRFWNDFADEHNQWDALSQDERDKLTAFADEGSGIGELREAASLVFRIEAAGSIDYEADNFERWKAAARDLAPRLRAVLLASPDIDRSGLAQE